MKVNSSQLPAFLKGNDISKFKKVLFYGNDESAIDFAKEQYIAKLKTLIDLTALNVDYTALDNPFALIEKLNTMDLFGTVELISLTNPKNFNKSLQQKLLSSQFHNYLIIDGGDLKPSSTLRKAFETSAGHMAIACYQDDITALRNYILAEMEPYKSSMDVATLLLDILPANRFIIRQEIEKLKLYKLHDQTITYEDVIEVCVDSKEVSFSEFNSAIMTCNFKKLSAIATQFKNTDSSIFGFIRILLRYIDRVYIVVVEKESGASIESAMMKLNPPVFFKEKEAFISHARSMSCAKLSALMGALTDFEYEVKANYLDYNHNIAFQNLFMRLKEIK